ncbi:helix-turn-helix domain-containing protein [Nocardia sp. NPDC059246]|uniref:helix-turn-helix domain-containing protein n=1 Tax=unclassified Nocardia TaxID=2637762 RepID=UPI0036A2D6E4
MTTTGEVIGAYLKRHDMSQRAFAREVDVDQRQIGRYISGEADPPLQVASRIADHMGITLTELAGKTARGLDFTGVWWAGWQTQKDGVHRVDVHPVRIAQDGNILELFGERVDTIESGAYEWTGELRLYDNSSLMGWYIASEGATRSKGVLYFALHPHGQIMIGGWVGLSYAAPVVRGWGAIARTEEQVHTLMSRTADNEPDLLSWDKMKSS